MATEEFDENVYYQEKAIAEFEEKYEHGNDGGNQKQETHDKKKKANNRKKDVFIQKHTAQKPTQFQRPLLRIGLIAFLAGVIIAVVSTAIHPSREDPTNHPLVFAEYASDDSWIAVHIRY